MKLCEYLNLFSHLQNCLQLPWSRSLERMAVAWPKPKDSKTFNSFLSKKWRNFDFKNWWVYCCDHYTEIQVTDSRRITGDSLRCYSTQKSEGSIQLQHFHGKCQEILQLYSIRNIFISQQLLLRQVEQNTKQQILGQWRYAVIIDFYCWENLTEISNTSVIRRYVNSEAD